MIEAAKGLVGYYPNTPLLPKLVGTLVANTIEAILKPRKRKDLSSRASFTPGIVSSSSKSPRHLVHKHNLSIGYEREYQLLGRVVPHDAVGDPARIRLLSSDRGDELTVYGSKDLLDTH